MKINNPQVGWSDFSMIAPFLDPQKHSIHSLRNFIYSKEFASLGIAFESSGEIASHNTNITCSLSTGAE
jgi:hypothetical protein